MPTEPTITIERMGYGPEGVGHLEGGKAVFVRGGVAGDAVRVRITEEKPSFARAEAVSIEEPSAERAPDWEALAADAALQAIAPWSQLAYAAQLAAKQGNVASALQRTAHLAAEDVERIMGAIVPCKDTWGYRNKLECALVPDARGRITLGFHEAGSSAVVAAKECRLGNRLLRRAPGSLTGALRYLAGSDDLGIYRVGIRASTRTDSVEVALWTPPSSFPRAFAAKVLRDAVGATSVVRVIAEAGASRRVKRTEVLDGDGSWRERAAGIGFAVSAPSFFQVNTAQAEELVAAVARALEVRPGMRVADLYAGVGTFSLPLAARGAEVVAVELEGSSARDFRANADAACASSANADAACASSANAEAACASADIICDDVARVLPTLGALDAVVVDPPRAGLHPDAVRDIAAAAPARIAYVSCDPQTLARDIARFAPLGYAPVSVTPVDLFPQTYHVESVCVLARR